MAGTRIETEFAALGADGVVRAFEAHDAALNRSTEAAREQSAVQSRQARQLRELREVEREEQQQLKQAEGIIKRTTTAEELHRKEIQALTLAKERGKISQKEFNRGLADSESRFKGVDASGGRVVGTLGRMVAGLGAVGIATQALRSVLNVTRELEGNVDNITGDVELAKTKLQIQGGFTDRETELQVGTIRRVLNEVPVTDVAGALAAQTELTSVGFNKEGVANGDALKVFAKVQAATGQFGPGADTSKAKETISAAGAVLAAGGEELNAANFERLSGKFVNLFASTPVQSTDLPQLAEATALLQALGVSEDERLGAFATGTQLLGAKKGTTALKQVGSFLRSTTGKKAKLNEEFGLNTEGFDLIGEGLADSLDNLKQQLAPLSEERQSQAIEKIFGKEAGANFLTLSGQVDSIRRNTQITGGDTFEKNVDLFLQSEPAQRIRTANETDFGYLDIDKQRGGLSFEEVREEHALSAVRRQVNATNPLERTAESMKTFADSTVVDAMEQVGVSPGTARNVDTRPAQLMQAAAPFFPAAPAVSRVADIVDVLREILATNQETNEAVMGSRDEPAAAKPFVPESVSNIEQPRVAALSAEAAR